MIKKLLICPFFGDFPAWMPEYLEHVKELKKHGYDILIDTDLEGFKKRVKDVLGIECPIVAGTGKLWDYRPTLGLLYAKECEGYDFWGHTDFDCVYGNVSQFFPDELFERHDVISNHNTYVCGFWSLYRNIDKVNNLFKQQPDWQSFMDKPEPNGWVETVYSRLLEESGLRYVYMFEQGNPYTTTPDLKFEDGKLYQDGTREIAMFHFRRSKKWPL